MTADDDDGDDDGDDDDGDKLPTSISEMLTKITDVTFLALFRRLRPDLSGQALAGAVTCWGAAGSGSSIVATPCSSGAAVKSCGSPGVCFLSHRC